MGKILISSIAIVAVALMLGMTAAEYSPKLLVLATLAVAIFVGAFVNSQFGLYILIFSMLLSPEFIASPTAGKELGRGVTLRLDDFILTVIGLGWLAKSAVHKELGLFLKTPLNRPIFIYLVVCLLSTGIGIMTGRAGVKTGFFFVLKYFEYFLVYFMVVNHLETREQMQRFLFCMFLTCFMVSLYGIFEIPGDGRVSAPFEGEAGEPNTFGGYLVFIGAVAAGLLDKIRNARLKAMLIVLIVVMIPPFLFTQSRSSYLAAIPVILVLGYLSEKRMIGLMLMLLVLALSPIFLPSQVKDRIMYTFTQPEESGQIEIGGLKLDTSTSARVTSWKEAIKDWTNHPFLGYGVTGYAFIDAQFPRVLVETGILGLAAFIYLLVSTFKIARSSLAKLKLPVHKGLVIGFIAGFIGLLFHAIGANTFIIVRIMEPFWLVAGMVVVLPRLESAEEATGETEPAGSSRISRAGVALGQGQN